MEIEAKKIDSANAIIEGKIPSEELESKAQDITKKMSKELNLPGFRKGKIPPAIVWQRYKEQIQKDAQSEVISVFYEEGIRKLNLKKEDILGEPIFSKFEEKDDEISIQIEVSIKPEINLEGYEESIPDFQAPQVTEDEVEKRITAIADSFAPVKKVEEERGLKKDDYALIDFKGFLNNEEIDGAKGENYQLKIGSNQFIKGFEENLIGMKPHEEKEFEIVFPSDYHNKNLASQKAKFWVKLKEIREKEPVKIDDELAKRVLPNEKEPTVEKLREAIKKQIQNEKLAKMYNEELKGKLVENLINDFEFDLPNSIVEQEINLKINEKLGSMEEKEAQELIRNEEEMKKLKESYKKEAQESVKATFIVDALAKKENIIIEDKEVLQTLYYEALQMGQNPQETVEMYQKQGLLPAFKMAMIEDRLLTHLLNKKLEGK
jgi:trigger factor